jgi:hypothetical protein
MVNAGQNLPGRPAASPHIGANRLIQLSFPALAGWQASGMDAPE